MTVLLVALWAGAVVYATVRSGSPGLWLALALTAGPVLAVVMGGRAGW